MRHLELPLEARVYNRREREYPTSYYCVQTPFAKYRGQVTLSYIQTYHKRLALYNCALVYLHA